MERSNKKIVISFFVFINCIAAYPQNSAFKNKLFLEYNYHYGFVAPHHDYMAYFINDHVQGIQLNIGLKTLGDKSWQRYYKLPSFGAGFYHSGLGNKEVYGILNAMYFFADRMYLKPESKLNIGNRICFGAGYVNKRFDLYSNSYDMAIGSHVNVFIQYTLEGSLKLSPTLSFKTGIGMTHVSNGNFQQPNKGINIVTAMAGLNYSLVPRKETFSNQFMSDDSTRFQYFISGIFGYKAISRFYHFYYPVYGLSAEFSRKVTRTGWLGIALTNYMDRSLKKELTLENPDTLTHTADYWRIALNLSYEMKMGRISYVFQPGIYLMNSYKETGPITNRMAIRYNFPTGWTAGIGIKAHWVAIADFIEWSIGYRWGK